jgi:hypothetical protein
MIHCVQLMHRAIARWHTRALLISMIAIVGFGCHSVQADDLDNALVEIRDHYQHGDYATAIPLAQRYAEAVHARYGNTHPKTMSAIQNVAELEDSQAFVLEASGHLPEAVRLRLDALAVRERIFGPDHAEVASSLSAIAAEFVAQGKYAEAEQGLRRALAIRERTLPAGDPDIIATLKELGDLFAMQGRYAEAGQFHGRVPPPPAPALGAWRPLGGVAFPEGQVLVFFATNREREDGAGTGFGSGRSNERTEGYAIVDVNRTTSSQADTGDLIRIVSDKTLAISEVRILDERAILDEVRPKMKHATVFRRQALVFVHGFNVSFDNALRRAAQLAHDLHFDGPVFVYSWPSHGRLADYAADHENSTASIHDLRAFLEFVVAQSGAETVHLIAHSMGNQVLLGALQEFRSSPNWADLHIGQVVLASPDVAPSDFQKRSRS